ncbi:MAG: PAS domain-containing protein, partial [Planctomycetes bacterium]|nr:PAS domain-containing protein [Planctomycetota bacterium]
MTAGGGPIAILAAGAALLEGLPAVACLASAGLLLVVFLAAFVRSRRRCSLQAARAIAEGDYRKVQEAEAGADPRIPELQQHLECFGPDLGRSLRKIAEERDRMEVVLGSILDGVIALDRTGSVRVLNPPAQRFFSSPIKDCIGRPLRAVCRSDDLVELAGRVLEEGQVAKDELQFDGGIFDVYTTSLKARPRIILILRDITEIRQLENLRRDFVTNVSHELKTPLTSIRAYVETLLDGGLEDQEVNLRFLKKIEFHATRLTSLITDLLTLSRIESGQSVEQMTRLNLVSVLRESFQRFGAVAEGKSIRLRLEVETERLEVLGETEALLQIFDNLIGNAVNYTERGGRVTVRAAREAKNIRVDVEDDGVGIPSEDLPRIFERFYRVDKARSREQGGTGLGLSIVKHNVQALDGEIFVRS